MAHNRKLAVSAADLVANLRLRIRDDIAAGSEVRDELEEALISTHYLNNAPFNWVGLTWRYGLKNEEVPQYQGIDKSDGELALAIELDAHELREADRDEFKRLLSIATLKALIHAGKKYELPTQALEERLSVLHGNTKLG
jgi:hypothetical protein